jgi:BirA family biotin operon repressor/biotin-[acetyl-CoA-carboxylase] ligase
MIIRITWSAITTCFVTVNLLASEYNLVKIFYREVTMIDSLDQRRVRAYINTRWLGKHIYYYPVVNSTNELLKEMASRGASSGTIIISDYQQKGKGRHGRRWSAPPKTSLLFSLLFRPEWSSDRANWLTMIAGLASASAIAENCSLNARLKWPNDVIIRRGNRWRKVGGILLEAQIENGCVHQAIVGIGLNVNIDNEALPVGSDTATSLMLEKKRPLLRAPLLGAILEKFEELYTAAREGRSPQPEWNERLITIGQQVVIDGLGANSRLIGRVEGTDASGRLLLRDTAGELHVISAGDVTLAG